MVQRRGGLSLALKAGQRLRILGHFIRQKLQGDESAQVYVLGLVDHAHAAAPELLDDAVVRDGLADHEETPSLGSILRKPASAGQRMTVLARTRRTQNHRCGTGHSGKLGDNSRFVGKPELIVRPKRVHAIWRWVALPSSRGRKGRAPPTKARGLPPSERGKREIEKKPKTHRIHMHLLRHD